jgi:adenylylsulfate kinase-like enzyme
MFERGLVDVVVDADEWRAVWPAGYSITGRRRNVERIQAVAAFLAQIEGKNVAVACIAPYHDMREAYKVGRDVAEVYLTTTEIRGREKYFVGVFEPPEWWDKCLRLDTSELTIGECLEKVVMEYE